MKKETKKKFKTRLLSVALGTALAFSLSGLSTILAAEPTVTIDKSANWVDIEEGIAKITLTETETVEEEVELSDYLIIYDVSGSMPIVTVNNYEPGTYNVDVGEVVNIGCKNPNHYSVLKPGYSDTEEGWRNAYHYDNNGTPDDTSDDILLNYTASEYQKMNWKGDVIQTFYLSSPKDFMYSRANGCYNTLDTSQEMLNNFINEVEKNDSSARFAYVAFGGSVVKYNGFTSGEVVKELINTSTQYEGTYYGPALAKADEILDTYTGDKSVKVIFLTDGNNYAETDALEYYETLKANHPDVEIYAVTADYDAAEDDDIRKMGDKYIYLTSENIEQTVSDFIEFSISKSYIKAGNKVYLDEVSDYFDIINTSEYPLLANTYANGKTIRWNIPTNDTNEATSYETSFYVKLKDEYRMTQTDTTYPTNKDTASSLGAKLTYEILGGDSDGVSKTLTHETPVLPYGLKAITVTKEWDDSSNTYNTRPSTITLTLNKNGQAVASKTISTDTTTFEGYTQIGDTLNVYSVLYDNNSQKVNDTYTITETAVENYKTVQNGTEENGYTVENKLDMPSELEIRYIDTEGNTLLYTKNYSGKVGQAYTTSAADIYGYKLTATPENASGNYDTQKTIVTYIYENVLTSIEVNHIDKYSGELLYTSTQTGIVGQSVTTSSRDIENYVLVEAPETEEYVLTKEKTVVNYYYAKMNNLVVKYVDEISKEEIADEETSKIMQGKSYETEKKEIENYTYTKDTGNTKGTAKNEDIEVTYYYKKNTTGIDVLYIDEVTKEEIADSSHIDGLEGDEYSTEEKKIEGYELVLTPANAQGELEVTNEDVVYKYRKVANLIVNHIDANTGKEIADTVITTYKEGEEYAGYSVNIDGYELVETPDETKGTMGREDVEMTFKYKKISAGLVVKYVDILTDEVLDLDTFEGNEKDVIELVEKTFEGYKLVDRPEEEKVELTVEPQEKVFYYKKVLDIKIKGIDQDTGDVLYTDSDTGLEGEKYETEPEEIEGYDLVVTPDNAKGVYDVDNEEIVYEYRKIAGDITVKYLDNYTYEELDSDVITGYVGDEYETKKKAFDKYIFVNVTGKTEGVLDSDKHEVVYYYEKIKGNLIVKYVDKDGNELLTEEYEGRVDSTFEVEEKTISGYTVVTRPDSLTGEYIDGTIELTFVLDKIKGQIVVNFVDTEGNSLYSTIYDEDYVGNDFYTEAPTIDGYTIISDSIVDKEFIDGELVVDVVYQKVEEQTDDTETPVDTVTTDTEDTDDTTTEVEDNTDEEATEIAKNPNTADINVVIYLVAFVSWIVVLVTKMMKSSKEE